MSVHTLYADHGIRGELADGHAEVWDFLSRPGSWLSADQKIAIAAETRSAMVCALCAERKAALSPTWVQGEHAATTDLPAPWVDLVHRITTDAGRMTRALFDEVAEQGIDDATWVEIVGVASFALSVDTFHRALGLPLLDLPTPQPGEPSRARPRETDDIGAWVPVLSKKSPEAPSVWSQMMRISNVARGLSLVPALAHLQTRLIQVQYLPLDRMTSFRDIGRSLSRAQVELVAGRVSAVNECFY